MPKVNCAVINCSNNTYKLKKWRQGMCYEHKDFDSSSERERLHSLYTTIQIILFSKHIKECRVKK